MREIRTGYTSSAFLIQPHGCSTSLTPPSSGKAQTLGLLDGKHPSFDVLYFHFCRKTFEWDGSPASVAQRAQCAMSGSKHQRISRRHLLSVKRRHTRSPSWRVDDGFTWRHSTACVWACAWASQPSAPWSDPSPITCFKTAALSQAPHRCLATYFPAEWK